LAVSGPWLAFFWIALVLCLFLAIWAYRAPVPAIPRSSRILLGLLRFVALGLVVFTLFQPVMTVASRGDEKPILPLLLDLSSSMNLPARAGEDTTTRFQAARDLVARMVPELVGDFDVRLYGFSADVQEITPSEDGEPRGLSKIGAQGPATAMGPALAHVLGQPGRRPVTLLLVSDGGANAGSDPLAAAERGGVPILTVPASLDSTVLDVWVAECLANRTAYLGQQTTVSVTLESELETATKVGVVLREDDRVITREHVTLPAGAGRVPIEIRFRPERLGVHRYHAEVEAVPGELASGNNVRAFAIKVQEERLQVLIIAGLVTWDFTFIRRALASDRTVAASVLARLDGRSDAFVPLGERKILALPTRASELAPFGTVVLIGVDPTRLPRNTREALRGFARDGGGVMIVAGASGEAFRGYPGSGLEELMPVRPAPGPTDSGLVACMLSTNGIVHPVTSFGESASRAQELWSGLPPVRVGQQIHLGLGAEVLVAGTSAASEVPLVVAGRTRGGRSLLVNATMVWRWGFLVPGMVGEDAVQRRFWSEAVRWLAEGRGGGNLELFADQTVFLGGKRVTLGAQLTDDELKPVDDAEVTIEVVPESGGDPVSVRMMPGEGSGQYAGEAGFLEPGLYRLRGTAERSTDRWTAEGEHFLVDQASMEGSSPAADPDLLRRLAVRTGGAHVAPEDAQDAVTAIARRRVSAIQTSEITLWNHAGMFMAFVSCVSLEWFLRRRRGLA
jgi:hypothetical protein